MNSSPVDFNRSKKCINIYEAVKRDDDPEEHSLGSGDNTGRGVTDEEELLQLSSAPSLTLSMHVQGLQ